MRSEPTPASTGIDNEANIGKLARVDFCSFHQGQWSSGIRAAVTRAAGLGATGGKHVALDDDGGSRTIERVRSWVKRVLDANGGCRASFNHKGPSPTGSWCIDRRRPDRYRACDRS